MKKRILSILMALSLCLGLMPVTASAAGPADPDPSIDVTLLGIPLTLTEEALDLSKVPELKAVEGLNKVSGKMSLSKTAENTYTITMDKVNVEYQRPLGLDVSFAALLMLGASGFQKEPTLCLMMEGKNSLRTNLQGLKENNTFMQFAIEEGVGHILVTSQDGRGSLDIFTSQDAAKAIGESYYGGIVMGGSTGGMEISKCKVSVNAENVMGVSLMAYAPLAVKDGGVLKTVQKYTDNTFAHVMYTPALSVADTLSVTGSGVVEASVDADYPNPPVSIPLVSENCKTYAGQNAGSAKEVNPKSIGIGDGACAVTSYPYVKIVAGQPNAPVEYPIWVGGKQITEKNQGNVMGNNTVSYDPEANVLTLKQADIKASHQAKYGGNAPNQAALYVGQKDLTIKLIGDNTLTGPANQENSYGLFQYGSGRDTGITLVNGSGDGSIPTLTTVGQDAVGDSAGINIYSSSSLLVNNTSLKASAGTSQGAEGMRYAGSVGIRTNSSNSTGRVDENGIFTPDYGWDTQMICGKGSILASGDSYAISGMQQKGAKVRAGDPLQLPPVGPIDLENYKKVEITNPVYFTRDGAVVSGSDTFVVSEEERTFQYQVEGIAPNKITWGNEAEYKDNGVKMAEGALTIPANFTTEPNKPIVLKGHRQDIDQDVTFEVFVLDKIPATIVGVSESDSYFNYTGEPQKGYIGTPVVAERDFNGDITVTYEGINGTNYGPQTAAPVNQGDYRVTFKAEDTKYRGSTSLDFYIAPASVAAAEVSVSGDYTYDGTAQTPSEDNIEVKMNGKTLVSGQDYTVEVSQNISAGDALVTVSGIGNYSGCAEGTFAIAPAPLTVQSAVLGAKTYDGTADVSVSKVKLSGIPASGAALTENVDYTATAAFTDPNAGEGNKTAEVSVVLNNTEAAKNYTIAPASNPLKLENQTIAQAAYQGQVQTGELQITNHAARTYSINVLHLIPTEAGQQLGDIGNASVVVGDTETGYTLTASAEGGTVNVNVTAAEGDAEKRIGGLMVRVPTQNFGEVVVSVDVMSVNKITPTGEPTLSKNELTYGQALKEIVLSGSMNDAVTGTFAWNDPDAVLDAGTQHPTWTFTPDNTEVYAEVGGTAEITVKQAKPTGKPEFTAIKEKGHTLAEAALTVGTIQPEGTIAWDLAADTEVEANKAYAWTFTPADEVNYEKLTGQLTPYRVSSGGGGAIVVPPVEPVEPEQPDISFVDVKEGDFFFEAVQWAVKNNITKGTSETTFSPALSCTRAEMVTFLWRAAGSPETKAEMNFSDVQADSWYADAVAWAVENKITSGTGGDKFSPDMICTRAQTVTFLWRAEGSPAAGEVSFADVPADAYYAAAVAWAVENKITLGTGADQFSPDRDCTRGEIVTFLYRTQAE